MNKLRIYMIQKLFLFQNDKYFLVSYEFPIKKLHYKIKKNIEDQKSMISPCKKEGNYAHAMISPQ